MPDPLPLVERLRDRADTLKPCSLCDATGTAYRESNGMYFRLPGPSRLPVTCPTCGDTPTCRMLREAAAALEATSVLLLAAEALASRRTCQCPADDTSSTHVYVCPIAIALEIRALRLSGSLPGPR